MSKKKVKGQPEEMFSTNGEQEALPVDNVTPGTPKERKPRVRTSKNYDQFSEITLVSDKNPKREGSKSHARFALYQSGQTVGDFIKLGGSFGDLAWDSQRNFITITPKPGAEVPATPA